MKRKAKKLLSFIMIGCLASGSVLPASAVQVSDVAVAEGISANEQQALADAENVNALIVDENDSTKYVDYYGGRYINDQRNLVVLLTAEATEDQIAEILSAISENAEIEFVTYSYNELLTAYETSSSILTDLSAKVKSDNATEAEKALYNNVVSISLSVQDNAIVVGLKEVTDETKGEFIEVFGDENFVFEQSDGAVTEDTVYDDIGEVIYKIKLNKKKLIMKKKETFKLKVSHTSKKNITWKSSDSKVAKVSKNGKVTALKKGKAKITAKIKGVKGKLVCKVTVKK